MTESTQDSKSVIEDGIIEASVRRRVKVYEMDSNNQWADKGTGHVACIYIEVTHNSCVD